MIDDELMMLARVEANRLATKLKTPVAILEFRRAFKTPSNREDLGPLLTEERQIRVAPRSYGHSPLETVVEVVGLIDGQESP